MTVRALLALAIALAAGPARAEIDRYAVVVGANLGAADEQQLRFAEADATRVSELLVELAGVRAENQIVLRGKSADPVRRALIATNERIRIGQRAELEAMLLVYYSGHGDADALHLGDSRFDLRELEALVRGSPAQIRILVIDACRSGSLTRVKGGVQAPPIALSRVDELAGEGVIVLTASTAGEDAQESDQLTGSFFTHYLLTALRGAADDNNDQHVTVAEAFRYTREHTVLASSRTLGGTQHPTFHFDLRGRADVVLAELGRNKERGQLALPDGATWLILRGDGTSVIGEIVAGARRRTLSLPPGRYVVRGRDRDGLLEGAVRVDASAVTPVDPRRLERTSYARLTRKGDAASVVDNRLFVGVLGNAPRIDSSLRRPGGVIGWTHARANFTFSTRLTGGDRVTKIDASDYLDGMVGLELRVAKVWDLVPGARAGRRSLFDVGLTGGVVQLRVESEFADLRETTFGWHVGLGLGLTLPLDDRVFVSAELTGQRYRFSLPPSPYDVSAWGEPERSERYSVRWLFTLGVSL